MDNEMTAFLAGQNSTDRNNCYDGMGFGGGWFIWIILIFAIFMGNGFGGFRINAGGLFRVSYDVTSTPGAAGAQVLQLYNGSTPMPCAMTTDTVAAGGEITQHVETVVRLATCCAIQPVISARLSGAAGTVSHVCASAVKLA